MRDILAEIITKDITGDQAYELINTVVGKFHDGELDGELNFLLGMDNFEWAAFCHAMDLEVLAEWRRTGWPDVCSFCHSNLNFREYGWTIQDDRLRCLNCL
ncbi:hypothetical protein [Planococcus versutus]|uniref:Uncharacterized protein n=1 Tax=Planococcus versutus TaxID=1302659 RepID=A0A1B1S1K5_9BACL|nr:hypothetical protein [Planococcus versutus]ANU27066.1 hypothetical protein I858_008690 [Planococcus versutus]